MNVVLISTYDLGHQPFGLASPAAWLKEQGASVTCIDLSVQPLPESLVASADLVAFYVPMHTATRIATNLVGRIKQINPNSHLCFYGLYAPVNESFLRKLGVQTILGGEFELELVALVRRLSANGQGSDRNVQREPLISIAKQDFRVPDRSGLPELSKYARLNLGDGSHLTVGYTEASRGCKHLCRHCPIVPVYEGKFRIVQREVVLEDIRRQVASGARHITFGDPDFFNGPTHALAIVKELHREFPHVTYDVTIKIEHLLKQAQHLSILRDTGCLFVTSAVESFDDRILEILDKRHTREDFVQVLSLFRKIGLTLNPTFVTFAPWTSLEGYCDFLATILELELVDNISPIQYAIRLLIPAGSKLLEIPSVQQIVEPFDEVALCYPWSHPDSRVDRLQSEVFQLVKGIQSENRPRREVFLEVCKLAHKEHEATVSNTYKLQKLLDAPARIQIPYLTEPWFC